MRTILAALFMTLATQLHSATECLMISDDSERLQCYDRVHGYNAGSQADAVYSGKWVFVEDKDPFNDTDVSYLVLESEAEGRAGRDYQSAVVVRCSGYSHQAYVISSGYLGRDSTSIKYRFADRNRALGSWNLSTDGKAVFAPVVATKFPLQNLRGFVKELRTGDDFVFEVRDYQNTPNVAYFDNSVHPKLDFVLNGCRQPEK